MGHFFVDLSYTQNIYICYKYTRVWPYYTSILWVCDGICSIHPHALGRISSQSLFSRQKGPCKTPLGRHVSSRVFGGLPVGTKEQNIHLHIYVYNNITTCVQIIKCHYNLLHILYTFSFIYIYIHTVEAPFGCMAFLMALWPTVNSL